MDSWMETNRRQPAIYKTYFGPQLEQNNEARDTENVRTIRLMVISVCFARHKLGDISQWKSGRNQKGGESLDKFMSFQLRAVDLFTLVVVAGPSAPCSSGVLRWVRLFDMFSWRQHWAMWKAGQKNLLISTRYAHVYLLKLDPVI
jgi:hypothetical protein